MQTNTTMKYTDFLLATASGRIEGERVPGKLATPFEKTKVAAYTLGAIAPCMRLFAFINKEIQALLDPNDSGHIYKKWIDHYCSQNFEAYAFRIEELLDTLSVTLTGDVKALNVYYNELACEEYITTGEIIKKLESPMEKLQAFNNILNNRDRDSQPLTVYIGGSIGDLLCMLEADIGIMMGSNPTLRRLGEQFGVSFVPLFSGLVVKQRELVYVGSSNWKKLSGTLYTVSSWDEIHAFIMGSSS